MFFVLLLLQAVQHYEKVGLKIWEKLDKSRKYKKSRTETVHVATSATQNPKVILLRSYFNIFIKWCSVCIYLYFGLYKITLILCKGHSIQLFETVVHRSIN